jgi:hypothetical protein
MTLERYYDELTNNIKNIQTMTNEFDEDHRINKAHTFIEEIRLWQKAIGNEEINYIFEHSINEVQSAILFVVSGLYRASFIALRLFLELTIAIIYFSDNKLYFVEWKQGRKDIPWGLMTDEEVGVLSQRYAFAFFPELKDNTPEYLTKAKNVYRELSEFVHGNAYTCEITPDKIIFKEDLFRMWADKFKSISEIIVFSLCCRYLKEIEEGRREILSESIIEKLGHITAIRGFLGGPVEDSND